MTHEAYERLRAAITGPRADKPAKPVLPRPPSYLEMMLANHLEWAQVHGWSREYRFDPERKWRIDFCWPVQRLAVEVQGEVHRIKKSFDADIEKIQQLTLQGWRYLPVSSADIRRGRAVDLIRQALQ